MMEDHCYCPSLVGAFIIGQNGREMPNLFSFEMRGQTPGVHFLDQEADKLSAIFGSLPWDANDLTIQVKTWILRLVFCHSKTRDSYRITLGFVCDLTVLDESAKRCVNLLAEFLEDGGAEEMVNLAFELPEADRPTWPSRSKSAFVFPVFKPFSNFFHGLRTHGIYFTPGCMLSLLIPCEQALHPKTTSLAFKCPTQELASFVLADPPAFFVDFLKSHDVRLSLADLSKRSKHGLNPPAILELARFLIQREHCVAIHTITSHQTLVVDPVLGRQIFGGTYKNEPKWSRRFGEGSLAPFVCAISGEPTMHSLARTTSKKIPEFWKKLEMGLYYKICHHRLRN